MSTPSDEGPPGPEENAPDPTRADETAGPGSHPAGSDAAQPGPAPTGPSTDAAQPETDATAETARLPATGDETAVLPQGGPAVPDRWTARAGIPPKATEPSDPYEPEDGGPSWWRPAVLGLVALLLLGMLLTGIWLIAKAREDRPGPAVPTGPAPGTTPPPTSRARPTSPPTTAAVLVDVPPVVGVDVLIAQDLLDKAGLTYRVTGRVSDRRPGTVLASTPEPGTAVPPRSMVNLIVAIPPPTTAAPTTPAVIPTT